MTDKQTVIDAFGFDPVTIGRRHRSWWIIEEPNDDDIEVGAVKGDLCVRARDGASNPIDVKAIKTGDCIGTIEDSFDRTYRYYYFRRPAQNEGHT